MPYTGVSTAVNPGAILPFCLSTVLVPVVVDVLSQRVLECEKRFWQGKCSAVVDVHHIRSLKVGVRVLVRIY